MAYFCVLQQLWDLRTLSIVHEYKGHTEAIEACIFLPAYRNDGRNLLATCSRDTSVRIWDRDTKGICLWCTSKLIILLMFFQNTDLYTTVSSEFPCDLYFAKFLFLNFSQAIEFASEYSIN